MRLQRLLGAVALVIPFLTAVGSGPASASPTGSLCQIIGTIDLNPGLYVVPPYLPGNYDFDSVSVVCGGGVGTPIGTVDSLGSYDEAGNFSGSLETSFDCEGTADFALIGMKIIGNVETDCGSGPITADVFVIETTGMLITNVGVVGWWVCLPNSITRC